MAKPGYDRPEDANITTDEKAAKLSAPEARQGQNIKGMVAVLAMGIALIMLAYAVMLSLSVQRVTPGGMPAADAPASSAPETAKSPS